MKQALIALLAASALSGCGGGDEETSPSPEVVAEAWARALDEGDGAAACKLLTPNSLELITKTGSTCKEAQSKAAGDGQFDAERAEIEDTDARVVGRVTGPGGTDSEAEGTHFVVILRSIDGEWKVDSERTVRRLRIPID